MNALPTIDPIQFVEAVQPLLEQQDPEGLLCLLKHSWTADQIVELLRCDHDDARKIAALALALVGGQCCLPPLVKQLKDRDPMVNQMAEHAIWSIWFRIGSCEANRQLARGADAMTRKDFSHAIEHFNRALQQDPDFAEAYNQRAIAHYLLEEYEESLADCRSTVERMPCHFGAWAGKGHCHAHLGQIDEAIDSYERALKINPHLDCIQQAVVELKAQRSD